MKSLNEGESPIRSLRVPDRTWDLLKMHTGTLYPQAKTVSETARMMMMLGMFVYESAVLHYEPLPDNAETTSLFNYATGWYCYTEGEHTPDCDNTNGCHQLKAEAERRGINRLGKSHPVTRMWLATIRARHNK